MQRINYFARILVFPTLLYAAVVVLNPFNSFGAETGERLFAGAYIAVAYHGKAAAIQLIGTTMIAFGIIISQGNLFARIASLLGTSVVWLGLVQNMADNLPLVVTTLVIFVGLTLLQAAFIGIHALTVAVARLTPRYIALLTQFANTMRRKVGARLRLMESFVGRRTLWAWRAIQRLWPF